MGKSARISMRTPVPDAATPSTVAREAAHRIILRRADRIAGEMEVRACHCDHSGQVHCGTLFAFAHDLAAQGCAHVEPASRLIDTKSVLIAPGAANRLTGEAIHLAGTDRPYAWQVTISDDRETVLAIFIVSFVADDARNAPGAVHERSATSDRSKPATKSLAPDSRLDRIVSAAAEVIARKGFAQASIREIAEAASLHVPTLYGHVSGKDELLELVYAKEMDLIVADLDQIVATGTPREQLRKMVSVAIEVADRRRREVGLLNRELKSLRPEARARTIARYRDLIKRYEAVIQAGVERGDFAPVDPLIAANFFEMASDMWGLRQFFFSDISMEHYRAAVISLVLDGICGKGSGNSRIN